MLIHTLLTHTALGNFKLNSEEDKKEAIYYFYFYPHLKAAKV